MRDGSANEFVLRRAEAADAICIAVLATQVFLDTYATDGIRLALAQEALETLSPAAIAQCLGRATSTVLVAERNGHLVGFAQLTAHSEHELVPFTAAVELNRLYVQEGFTGRGVGKALLRLAEETICASGAEGIWLTAWSRNARALAFYARQGYADLGPTLFTVQGEQHENRLFAKPLGVMARPSQAQRVGLVTK